MAIEIPDLDKWNAWLGGADEECQCCGMTECDEVDWEMQSMTRNLCGIYCLSTEPWIGTPIPVSNGVSAAEILAIFRSVKLTEQWEEHNGDDTVEGTKEFTFWKDPRTQEENLVAGTYGCNQCRFTGSYEQENMMAITLPDDYEIDVYSALVADGTINSLAQGGGEDGTHFWYQYIGGVLVDSSTEPYDSDHVPWNFTPDTTSTTLDQGSLSYVAEAGSEGSDWIRVELEFEPYDAETALQDLNDALDDLDESEYEDEIGETSTLFSVTPVAADDFPDTNPRIQGALLRRARIRFKIPYPWERDETQTHGTYYLVTWDHLFTPQAYSDWEDDYAAWEDARDAWVALDPEANDPADYSTAAPEQPEGKPLLVPNDNSPWEWAYPTDPAWLQWVEDYETYRSDHADWETARDEWVDEDPYDSETNPDGRQPEDYEEEEPTAPDEPESDNPWYSDWYEIGLPEAGEPEPVNIGAVTVVNVRRNCYQGTVYGTKPEYDDDFEEFDPHPDR